MRFPSALPAPIDLWTGPNGILSRHGHLVDSLSIKISDSWTESAEDQIPSRFDNVDFGNSSDDLKKNLCSKFNNTHLCREYLSPETVTKLLELCQNLETFKVIYPQGHHECYEEKIWTAVFRSVIVRLISKETQLQRLKIGTSFGDVEGFCRGFRLPEREHVRMVKKLPLLQSFSASNTSANTYNLKPVSMKNSLGWNLSQLQHLTRLHLDAVDSLDEKWCEYPWPMSLSDVSLTGCRKLGASEFHQLIHHIAPNVSRLRVDFNDPTSPTYANEALDPEEVWSGLDVDPNWTPQHRFKLPLLTTLTLFTSIRHELLTAFQDCIGLRELYYPRLRLKDWSALKDLLCDKTWPQLEVLKLVDKNTIHSQWHLDPKIEVFRNPIQAYCEQFGVEHQLRYVCLHVLSTPFSLHLYLLTLGSPFFFF